MTSAEISKEKQISPNKRANWFLRKNWLLSIVLVILAYLIVSILVSAFSDPEEMKKLIRLTYSSFSEGALLALIALGLVLVYKSTDVINFAHGEFMVLGGFVGYQMMIWLQPFFAAWIENPIGSFLIAMIAIVGMTIVIVILAIILERLVLRPLIGEPVISVIMVTIGLSNIIHAIVGLIWGNNPVGLPFEVLPTQLISESGRFELTFEGTRRPLFLQHENLMLIAVVVLVTFALLQFFQRSRHGIAMRATADDQQAAMSMGISIRVVFAFAWALAAVTAALAGLMLGETAGGVSAQIIPITGLRAFPVIILGGLDSITGAIIGGLIIGFVETFTGGYIDPSLKDIAPYVILLIVMMIRPYGLFGQEIIERV
jgi:branched-chain amino acid transport system permease protein